MEHREGAGDIQVHRVWNKEGLEKVSRSTHKSNLSLDKSLYRHISHNRQILVSLAIGISQD